MPSLQKRPRHKRVITPHKGGRDQRAPSARVSAKNLDDLKSVLSAREMTFADWLIEKIDQDVK